MTGTARLSQNDRVLRQLRRGPIGPTDFMPPTADGGAPIMRLGARVHVLRSRGHVIESRRDKSGCAVYKLIRDAEQASGSAGLVAPEAAPSALSCIDGAASTSVLATQRTTVVDAASGRVCNTPGPVSPVVTATPGGHNFDARAEITSVETGSTPTATIAPTTGSSPSSSGPVETFETCVWYWCERPATHRALGLCDMHAEQRLDERAEDWDPEGRWS